jgi:hypothetical protein
MRAIPSPWARAIPSPRYWGPFRKGNRPAASGGRAVHTPHDAATLHNAATFPTLRDAAIPVPGHVAVGVAHQGGEERQQAEAVEGGMVAGDGQTPAARPGDHPQRRLGGQVEAVDEGRGVQGVAIDDQGVGGRTRVPGLPAEPRPGHRDGAVEGVQAVLETVDGGGQGGGGHHRPGGAAVGEAQQGQRVGRGRGRQSRPATGHPTRRPR